jgi:hypothetical protein
VSAANLMSSLVCSAANNDCQPTRRLAVTRSDAASTSALAARNSCAISSMRKCVRGIGRGGAFMCRNGFARSRPCRHAHDIDELNTAHRAQTAVAVQQPSSPRPRSTVHTELRDQFRPPFTYQLDVAIDRERTLLTAPVTRSFPTTTRTSHTPGRRFTHRSVTAASAASIPITRRHP